MKTTVLVLLILNFCLIGTVAAQKKTRPKKKTPVAATTNGKIVYEPDAEMLRNVREKARVVESKQDWAELDHQSAAVNQSKTRTAYVARFKMETNADALFDVVVVEDAKTKNFYEIRGIDDFPWRPLSDFKWISDDVLQFEQWVNPTNGGRYQINLKTGKVVAAGYVRSN